MVGGAIAQTFLYPVGLIRNAGLGADRHETRRAEFGIAGRAISSMIACSGQSDIPRPRAQAKRDGIKLTPTYLLDGFTLPSQRPFDRGWMRALSENGRRHAFEARAWDCSRPAPTGGR